jgi:hypothetical protein
MAGSAAARCPTIPPPGRSISTHICTDELAANRFGEASETNVGASV